MISCMSKCYFILKDLATICFKIDLFTWLVGQHVDRRRTNAVITVLSNNRADMLFSQAMGKVSLFVCFFLFACITRATDSWY